LFFGPRDIVRTKVGQNMSVSGAALRESRATGF
jgi:hypothetical protein